MGVEDFEVAFDVVDFVLCSDCLVDFLKLNQGAGLVLHENHSTNVAKVTENIVQTLMTIAFGNRTYENHLRRAVLYHELLGVRID